MADHDPCLFPLRCSVNPRLVAAARAVTELARRLPDFEAEHGAAAASAARRKVAEADPLRFALTYLPHHMKDADGAITLSTVHEEWIDAALTWGDTPEPGTERDAYVAPREMGKSTWWFLLLPMWAAATGRVSFAAAFADSAAQAEGHLSTFKRELDENRRLREDYPDLCAPAVRPKGSNVADNRAMLQTRAGFVFAARGIDSGNLGMKVGAHRPDLLILDDVEPGEANYSGYQVDKRLGTVLDVVLPLNVSARVVLVGTVTMPGSIVHQLVRHAAGEEPAAWVKDERFRVHHAVPFTDEGESVWPEKWPTDYLLGIRHTRSFAKNFLNEPVATDGDYWTPDTFRYGTVTGITRQLLSVDPAVTTKTTSDYTGLAVVGLAPAERRCVVRAARQVRQRGPQLRRTLLALLDEFPETTHIYVESNQGGDTWHDTFHDMPVPVVAAPAGKGSKEVRAAEAVNHYERGRVLHEVRLPEVEAQMCSFPKAPHDDMVDAVGNAVCRLLRPKAPKKRATAATMSYA
jgi:phage terminase large subunit-like protein